MRRLPPRVALALRIAGIHQHGAIPRRTAGTRRELDRDLATGPGEQHLAGLQRLRRIVDANNDGQADLSCSQPDNS